MPAAFLDSMRYVVGYAAYALSVTGLLLYLVPPQAPAVQDAPAVAGAEQRITLHVIDDYFAEPCATRVDALAADMVMFHTREEFDEAVKALGC